MASHVLEVKLSQAREVFERNFRGEPLEGSRAKHRIVCLNCDIRAANVRAGVPLRVTIPTNTEINSECPEQAIAWHARLALPSYFGQRQQANVFFEHRLDLEPFLSREPLTADSDCRYMQAIETAVSAEFWESLLEQTEKYNLARSAFDNAVSVLKEHSDLWPDGLRSKSSEIQAILDYLEDCLALASLGFLYSWYQEKHGRIRSAFDDLLRRKDSGHPNYKTNCDFIRDTLFSYRAPEYWTGVPPHPVI